MEETCCNKCANDPKNAASCGQYGEDVARAALDVMEAEQKRADAVSANAQAFIDACEKAGRNPISVVKFVAGKNGIGLSGSRPDDAVKASLYDLLREVVDTVVESFFEPDDASDDEDDETDEEEFDPTVLVARNNPVRKCRVFGYAFSW